MKVKFKKLIFSLIIIFLSILIIVFSVPTTQSIIKSFKICLEVIIPSTFIFMVISTYILSSELYKLIFYPAIIVLRKIIKLNDEFIAIFLLSLIGGYPLGFKLLKEVIAENNNYHEIAVLCSAFCYCISPTFAVTMLGIGLFNSIEAGLIIYLSNVISCFIMAVIYSRIFKIKHIYYEIDTHKEHGIIYAINEASVSLFKMCSVIIFFNAIITVIDCFLSTINYELPQIIKPVLEISNILTFNSLSPASIPLISAFASFGGICVIIQCKSLAGSDFTFKKFFISRFIAFIFSYLITEFILKLWDISIVTQTGSNIYTFDLSEKKSATVFLLIMLMLLMKKSEKNFKKG